MIHSNYNGETRAGQEMGDFCRQTVLISMISLLMTSCSPFLAKKSPIILILVESFSEQNYVCSDPRMLEDLEDLRNVCNQFVRFTHAFAPSTLSQPVLASLFTGVAITEHGVTHNGPVGLSGRFQTLSEHALSQQMRTGFFSGGIPLMDKFGISQGFESFDDSYTGKGKLHFRPFLESIHKSLKWVDDEVGKDSFFITYYVPDLMYSDQITYSNIGSERSRTRHAQLQEFSESLNHLVKELKDRKQWDKSHVIVLGLGGEAIHQDHLRPLSSAKLRVPLQIKLAKGVTSNLKKFESHLLSFHKIGQWFRQLVFHKATQGSLLFSAPKDEPFIPLRSDWSRWLGLQKNTIYGLRRKQYLFTFSPEIDAFDSFVDSEEDEPLEKDVTLSLAKKYELDSKVKNHFDDKCLFENVKAQIDGSDKVVNCYKEDKKISYRPQVTTLNRWSKIIWNTEGKKSQLTELIRQGETKKSLIVQGWLAQLALQERDWDGLVQIGKLAKNRYIKTVALKNKGDVYIDKPKGCIKYFLNTEESTSNFYRNCENSSLRKVIEGIKSLKVNNKPEKSFWQQVYKIKSLRNAKSVNLKMHFVNDVEEPFKFSPTLAELYFYLPENKAYLDLINIDET